MRFISTEILQSLILTGLFLFTCVGCGSGTSATTSSTTTQPTQPTAPVAPAVPAGWTNFAQTYFSFSYPSDWQLSKSDSATTPYGNAVEPDGQHQLLLQFGVGIVNPPGTVDKCADVVQYLIEFYNAKILPYATRPGSNPYTTTTYDLPQPGYLGGKEIQIHVVTTQKSAGPNFNLWLNGVPRTDGVYLVGYLDPGDPYETWVPARKKFTDTIFFNSKPLPSIADCNYLAK